MKDLKIFILEKLIINKDIKINKHIDNDNIVIEIDGKEYDYMIGDKLQIVDHAESPEEAIVMIKRDSDEGDRFYWLRPLDNGNYTASLDYYWVKYTKDNYLLKYTKDYYLLKSVSGIKYKESNIISTYNEQHMILCKVEKI